MHNYYRYRYSGVMPLSIDPVSAFPSVQIYPSSNYSSKESGSFYGKCISPTSYDLDPYFFLPSSDFNLAIKDTTLNSHNSNIQKNGPVNQVRTMGLKGPMFFSGWGYDTAGLPVPNNEPNPSGKYEFHPQTAVRRNLWKTGPVDLRWHNKRKVWVGGHEMLEGYLMGDLDGIGEARMQVYRPSGSSLGSLGEYITVKNMDPSLSASSGTYCMVVDINYEWRPVWVGC